MAPVEDKSRQIDLDDLGFRVRSHHVPKLTSKILLAVVLASVHTSTKQRRYRHCGCT